MQFRFLAALTLMGLILTVPLRGLQAESEPVAQPGFIPPALPVSDQPYSEDDRVVIGRDDRQPVLTSAYPYSAIGRIDWVLADGRTIGYCTGTLIGRDLVLTNAHCLQHPRTDRLVQPGQYGQGGDRIVFKAGMVRGVAQVEAAVRTFESGWVRGTAAADDWAILKLERPLGDRVGYLGWLDANFTNPNVVSAVAGKLRLVGYAGDFPTAALQEFGRAGDTAGYHEGCSVIEGHNQGPLAGLIFHACDTNPGASGSAIFARFDDGSYQVLGLHAGANELHREVVLPTGDRTRYLNRGVQVNRWSSAAQRLK